MPIRVKCASIVEFDQSHNICCVYDEKLPKMAVFKDILEFMKRLPIQKALTNQHSVSDLISFISGKMLRTMKRAM
ncbi:hypothetical protein Hanom_Chr16g01486851 [Helianthus anomalus]